jgi:hypothetical protein
MTSDSSELQLAAYAYPMYPVLKLLVTALALTSRSYTYPTPPRAPRIAARLPHRAIPDRGGFRGVEGGMELDAWRLIHPNWGRDTRCRGILGGMRKNKPEWAKASTM